MYMQNVFDKEPIHLPAFFLENLPLYIKLVKVIWAFFWYSIEEIFAKPKITKIFSCAFL